MAHLGNYPSKKRNPTSTYNKDKKAIPQAYNKDNPAIARQGNVGITSLPSTNYGKNLSAVEFYKRNSGKLKSRKMFFTE